MMTFNLTPKRIEALRLISRFPGIYVGGVAHEVLTTPDRKERGLWQQAATRLGAGYCQKLQAEGLITIDTFVDCGYGRCYLTDAGKAAL